MKLRADRFKVTTSSWKEQFEDAVNLSGEADEEGNPLPPTYGDFFFHLLTIFWKVFLDPNQLYFILPPHKKFTFFFLPNHNHYIYIFSLSLVPCRFCLLSYHQLSFTEDGQLL